MKINLPCHFDIKYPKENRAYYSGAMSSQTMIRSILLNASNGYCMYCGTLLYVENMDISQIEHSVDKNGNKSQSEKISPLTNCKYNLSITCQDCNMKYKKQVKKIDLAGRFGKKCPKKCEKPCEEYKILRKQYIIDNSIILQPQGILDEDVYYGVVYDTIKNMYGPNDDEDDRNLFIQQHIIRFRLNGEKRSDNVIDICSDIVELYEMGVSNVDSLFEHISKKKQVNVIGKEFIQKLRYLFPKRQVEELVEYCRMTVICSAWI